MAIGSWSGKMPSKKQWNDGEVLCPKCTKINQPSENDRKRGTVVCKRCSHRIKIAKS